MGHDMRKAVNWKRGFALALVTATAWGLLPLALKITLEVLDPYTITWVRFLTAALVLGGLLAVTRRLPSLGTLDSHTWLIFGVALFGLVGNFVLYLVALGFTTPTVNQTVVQLSPMLLLLGGLIVFDEKFSPRQWLGFGVLVVGLVLFFNRRLVELRDFSGGIGLGVALLVIASIIWAMYGLAQKTLLRQLTSQQILVLIYAGATVLLLPTASPGEIRHLNALHAWTLAFCCANTLIAYGAFVEALECWEVSRVSAVLALAPLVTMTSMVLMQQFAPGLLQPEGLNVTSVVGALLVVGGSALCALGSS
jgi:drug/metabolite transporter (DMT)-like permease